MMVMCSPTGDIFRPPEHNNDDSDDDGGDITIKIEIDIATLDEMMLFIIST